MFALSEQWRENDGETTDTHTRSVHGRRSLMRRIPPLFAVLAVSFAACGGNDDPAPGPGSSPEDQGGLTISMATTDFGSALVDQEGTLLYMFVPDQQENGTPTCYDDCAEAWPALEGEANPGEGVDEGLLGTVERTDGTQRTT